MVEFPQGSCKCWNNCDWHLGKICNFSNLEIMEVDHIKPKSLFPEEQNNLDNLITLCPNCHRRKTNQEIKIRYKKQNA